MGRLLLRSMAAALAAPAMWSLALWSQNPAPDKGTPVFGTTVVIPSGLVGRVYYMRTGESYLPHFETMRPVGVIYATSLNVPPQLFSVGFPGVTKRFEWFAIDYRGRFWIDTPDTYKFTLTSDDGSILYIDDHALINLDGTHEAISLSKSVKLDCGIHSIRVSYFQGPRFEVALILEVAGGGRKQRIFNTEEFKPPPNPEEWKCGGEAVAYDPNRRKMVPTRTLAFEAEALEVLRAQPRPEGVPFRSAVFQFWKSPSGSHVSFVVSVPGTGLSATHVVRGSLNRVHVAVLALVKGEDGHTVEKLTLDAPYEFSDPDYAAARSQDLVFSYPLHLPDGHYTVETAVMDREAQRAGAGEIAVEASPQRSGIGLSSLILVDRVEPVEGEADAADPLMFAGKRIVPRLSPLVNADSKPLVYFVAYPNPVVSIKPTVQVQFLNGDRLVAQQTGQLPDPDSSGAVPMFLQLATNPGDAEVRVTVRQGDNEATDSLHYRVNDK